MEEKKIKLTVLRYKLRLTLEQKKEFDAWLSSLQSLHNSVIEHYRYLYSEKIKNPDLYWYIDDKGNKTKQRPKGYTIRNLITQAMGENPGYFDYLLKMPSITRSAAILNACDSYEKYFKALNRGDRKAGKPKFKTKSNPLRSLVVSESANGIKLTHNNRRIKIPVSKNGNIACQYIRFIPCRNNPQWLPNTEWFGEPRTARIKKEPTGEWFITITVEDKRPQWDMIPNKPVGIDMNLTDSSFLAFSDGRKIERIRHFDKMQHRLKLEQRKLSRKQEAWKKQIKGKSKEEIRLLTRNNYEKQRIKVAKIHARIANMREAEHNRIVKDVVLNHSKIIVEDLNTKNMMHKKRHLGKSFADAGFGYLRTKIENKCNAHGREFIAVDPRYTSQMCSSCGHIPKKKKGLSVRSFVCENCGAEHDRDINAAINILNKGMQPQQEKEAQKQTAARKPKPKREPKPKATKKPNPALPKQVMQAELF